MSTRTKPAANQANDAVMTNEVLLRGRLSADPVERILPSGDPLWTFRVVVPRPARQGTDPGPTRVDPLECAVWSARLRRSVATWREGDLVEVHGGLRRRFYRSGAATVSRVEVEVERSRLIRRAPVPRALVRRAGSA